jgi:hypothetical protein
MTALGSLYGMNVHISPLLPMQKQKRLLLKKPWHGKRHYLERINKKWRKRFGTETVSCLMSQRDMFVSRALFDKLVIRDR